MSIFSDLAWILLSQFIFNFSFIRPFYQLPLQQFRLFFYCFKILFLSSLSWLSSLFRAIQSYLLFSNQRLVYLVLITRNKLIFIEVMRMTGSQSWISFLVSLIHPFPWPEFIYLWSQKWWILKSTFLHFLFLKIKYIKLCSKINKQI